MLSLQIGVTADTVLKLGKYFDNDPVYWLTLQIMYDLAKEKEKINGQ